MSTRYLVYFLCGTLGFQYANAEPIVTSIFPVSGTPAGGNTITIIGSGFTGASDVAFGARPANAFLVVDDSTISATVPVGTVGTVDVAVTAFTETSALSADDYYSYTSSGWDGIVSGSSPDQVAFFNSDTNTFNSYIALPSPSLASVITPDGTRIYTADDSPEGVTVIDVATSSIITTIPTSNGPGAFDLIVNPAGTRVYVSNFASGYLTVIDTTTNTVDTDLYIGGNLGALSITPDGTTVYVSNFSFGGVIVIDTATNTIANAIATGYVPGMISITPDGVKAFVCNSYSDTISVIDLATQTVTNTIAFPPGSGPYGSSILPNGITLYVASIYDNGGTVSVIDVASELVTATIPLGNLPFWIASTPDSQTVYVINETNDYITPIDVTTNTASAPFGGPSGNLQDIVMTADQAPIAVFTTTPQLVGVPTAFDASGSFSPVGTVVSYDWDFGDGTLATTPSPYINHTYTTAGLFNVTLTVTNSAGTSDFKVFSSRFMSNNGGATAVRTKAVEALPTPPSYVIGFQERYQNPYHIDITNVVQWNAPVEGWTPASYKIYRDSGLTDLIGTVPGTAPRKFYDHDRLSQTSYTYYVVSISITGAHSVLTSVTISPVY